MNMMIVLYALVSCFLLFIFEQAESIDYFFKTGLKIFLFAVIPVLYVIKNHSFSIFKGMDKKGLILSLFLGILSFSTVLIAYYSLENFIDISAILTSLKSKGITVYNFIFIGLYVSFGNSFLEEFFFRGFIFLNLYKANKTFAYVFSALLFSLYHIAIFATWFNIWITLLALLGLFIIGLIFNWMNVRTNSMLNSWMIHICADLAIIFIGLQLFDIL